MNIDFECPICLEGGAKVVLCTDNCKREIRYHPSCIAALEEAGFATCPICRQSCSLRAKASRGGDEEEEEEQGTPSSLPTTTTQRRRHRGWAAAGEENPCEPSLVAASWILLVGVAYCMSGFSYGFIRHLYDRNYEYAWLHPKGDVRFNMTSCFEMRRASHPEISDRDWKRVLEWVLQTEDQASINVITHEGPGVRSTVSFLNHGHQDFWVEPRECFSLDPEGEPCEGALTVAFMHANHFRGSMDPFETEFLAQAFISAIFAFSFWNLLCRRISDPTTVPSG